MSDNNYCDRCFKKAIHKPYCDDCIVYFMSKSIFYKIDCQMKKYYITDPVGCVDHTCKYTNCNKFVLNSSYCEKHYPKCEVCSIKLIDNYTIESKICLKHKCVVSLCINKKFGSDNNLYCSEHKCIVNHCYHKRYNFNNENYLLCLHHKCKKIDCCFMVYRHELCREHVCSFAVCKNISFKNGKCKQHQEIEETENEDETDNEEDTEIFQTGNCSTNSNEKTETKETNEKIVKKEVEVIVCSICMNKAINTILDCGHTGCLDCLSKLKNCHCCRENINNLKPVYL